MIRDGQYKRDVFDIKTYVYALLFCYFVIITVNKRGDHLSPADLGDVVIPRTRTVGFGLRSFSASGPPTVCRRN